MLDILLGFWESTGFSQIFLLDTVLFGIPLPGHLIMICLACLFLYLAIHKGFEPYLLIPIAFGMLLVNLPFAGLMDHATESAKGGLLYYLYQGVDLGIYPPLIFLCIGAGTDFGPLLANPKSLLLGAAAQLGIFTTFFGAIALGFTGPEAASIGGQIAPHVQMCRCCSDGHPDQTETHSFPGMSPTMLPVPLPSDCRCRPSVCPDTDAIRPEPEKAANITQNNPDHCHNAAEPDHSRCVRLHRTDMPCMPGSDRCAHRNHKRSRCRLFSDRSGWHPIRNMQSRSDKNNRHPKEAAG